MVPTGRNAKGSCRVIGVTGSFGSGKTTVAKMLARPRGRVIDGDELARHAVEPGRPALEQIKVAFGCDLVDAESRLRRRELAQRVFGDRSAVRRLNQIVHPYVRAEAERLMGEWKTETERIILDVPLLFEARMQDMTDLTVVVIINERQRFGRLKRRGFHEREVMARLATQMSQARKMQRADYVIDNSGGFERTGRQVDDLLEHLEGVKTQ